MKRRPRNKVKKSGSERLFGFATTVLSVMLVILTIVFVSVVFKSRQPYITEADEILRLEKRADYGYAITSVYENRANGVDENTDPDYIEGYAVVDYYQAEVEYKMSIEAGNSSKAAAAKAKMNDAYQKMGNMQFKASEIDEMIMGE